jgi:hypothetical protein
MLTKAVAALKADKAKTLDMINKGEGGFLDRDLYVFCANVSDGKSVALGNPNAKQLLARSQRLLQRSKIVEGDLDALWQKRTEARAEILIAVQRQRTIGQTVKGVTAINNAAAAGRGAGKFYSRFNGFCAGIGKEDFVEMGHKFEQALGQNT